MLANRLRAILAERNMSITTLAQNTSLSRNTISNLVNNPEGTVNMKTVDEICSFLGLEIDEFFYYSPYFQKDAVALENPKSKLDPRLVKVPLSIQGKVIPLTFSVTTGYDEDDLAYNEKIPDNNFMQIEAFDYPEQTEKIYASLPDFFKEKFLDELWNAAHLFILSEINKHSSEDTKLPYLVSYTLEGDPHLPKGFEFDVVYKFNETEISRFKAFQVDTK
ncbi:helix-turn-helix domain-containing protein [Limosilactobacillus ingluviei]|uniref:helix-turn-helix domain-containing protein n=1 Tax=Limosilactobacillus ingluviei TaxID=148604 RepID=UPI0024BA2478|nr:helix-turn-helix transcriptional regulator [Limosilactobacillus ingluviei]